MMVQGMTKSDPKAPAWLTHADYEQMDPTAAHHAQQMELQRKRQMGEKYTPSREFPCPGTFRLDGPQIPSARLYVCDHCGEEMGVPVGMLKDGAATKWLVDYSGLPKRHAATELVQNDANLDARVALKAWAEGWTAGQLSLPPMLVGEVGRGKTQLLVAAAIAVMNDTGKPVRYWSLSELLSAERRTFDTKDASPVAAAKLSTVLILDDIGAELDSPFALDTLGQIIDARYRSGLPTLGATNVMPNDWPAVFGDRTASRLLEVTAPVLVGGHDWRTA